MSEINPPGFLQTVSQLHPAKLFRRTFQGAVKEGVSDFNGADDLKVVESSPAAMSVRVSRGAAFIQGDDTTDQGIYFCYNDGFETITIAAANATNPRDDIIVARVRDNTEGVAGDAWSLEVVAGTPAASPVEPATPASALKLATVRVGAAVTSIVGANITDRRLKASGQVKAQACRVWKSADQVLASNTPVTWDSEDFDTNNLHDTVTNNSRFTVPAGEGGYWIIQGSMGAAPIRIRKNGATVLVENALGASVFFSHMFLLAAGDYLELLGRGASTASGGNPATDATAYSYAEFFKVGV